MTKRTFGMGKGSLCTDRIEAFIHVSSCLTSGVLLMGVLEACAHSRDGRQCAGCHLPALHFNVCVCLLLYEYFTLFLGGERRKKGSSWFLFVKQHQKSVALYRAGRCWLWTASLQEHLELDLGSLPDALCPLEV